MGKVNTSKDLLMLLLYARGPSGQQCEPARGRTRLMKMVFLFDKEVRSKFNLSKVVPKEALPDFTAYDFGPFSATVFSDLEFLVELGFVEVRDLGATSELLPEEAIEYEYWQAGGPGEQGAPESEEEFSLTAIGREFVAEGHAGTLTAEQWRTLDEFKTRCSGTSLRALLRYVYANYPQMTTKSKIRDEILSE